MLFMPDIHMHQNVGQQKDVARRDFYPCISVAEFTFLKGY